MEKKKASRRPLNKLIVGKFVKKEAIVWPREMKIANTLLETYPDYEFWDKMDLGFKLNSLAWFIGEGKNELFSKWNVFKLELPTQSTYIIGNEKVGEDYVPPRKTISKKEWLKIW